MTIWRESHAERISVRVEGLALHHPYEAAARASRTSIELVFGADEGLGDKLRAGPVPAAAESRPMPSAAAGGALPVP